MPRQDAEVLTCMVLRWLLVTLVLTWVLMFYLSKHYDFVSGGAAEATTYLIILIGALYAFIWIITGQAITWVRTHRERVKVKAQKYWEINYKDPYEVACSVVESRDPKAWHRRRRGRALLPLGYMRIFESTASWSHLPSNALRGKRFSWVELTRDSNLTEEEAHQLVALRFYQADEIFVLYPLMNEVEKAGARKNVRAYPSLLTSLERALKRYELVRTKLYPDIEKSELIMLAEMAASALRSELVQKEAPKAALPSPPRD